MKFLFLLGLVALASARSIENYGVGETFDMIGYMSKYAIPLANEIRKAEEEAAAGLRIVGGSAASLGQFPYQAGLLVEFPQGSGVCGASLISNTRLLTAAHCWFDGQNQGSSVTVVLGSTTLFTGGTRIITSNVIMHPQWTPSLIRNDIAMLRTSSSVEFSNTISPIGFAIGLDNFAGEIATASGFGRTADGATGGITTSQFLSFVDLPVITNLQCSLSFPFIIQSTNICTSGANGSSTCQGDSGGPLVVERNNNKILIGITSFGSAAGCQAGFSAAFVRVSSYTTWINQNM